jgi:hypothetical protein
VFLLTQTELEEWFQLIAEAIDQGITEQEIRDYLKNYSKKAE